MARAGNRQVYEFETDLTELGWSFARQCKCGGVLKLFFFNAQKQGAELKVMPNKKRFEVREKKIFGNRKRNIITIQGALENMKTLLAAV